MDKKICLITGASSGIGKAAAVQIAQKGYHVILACRNKMRGEAALNEVREASKSNSVELMIVDMSLQSSIKSLAGTYLAKYDTLDVLIRIITIASKGLITFPFLNVSIEDPEFKHHKFSVVKAYYQSKLAQIMYTYWLARKLEGTRITVNSIRVTNVKVDINRFTNLSRMAEFMYSLKSKFSISTEEMAKTYTHLATSDLVGEMTGKYFDEKNRQVNSSKYSCNSGNINAIMDITMKYLNSHPIPNSL